MKYFYILLPLLFLLASCRPEQMSARLPIRKQSPIQGLSFVAPPRPFSSNPMEEVKASGAEWIAVIPYAFTRLEEPVVHYNEKKWQWWGERPEGTRETIRLAHENGIQVMLKPQVYVPRSWPGGLDFSSDAEWKAWETSYEAYILPMATLAQEMKVDLFCIGTEFKVSSVQRPEFWQQLVTKIRSRYDGPLTYAANWDEYPHISFWKDLDYIGVDAYFPLVESATPSVREIKKAWQTPLAEMNQFAQKQKRPFLFTEFGYLSVDGCAHKNWELEGRIEQLSINEQAQANALDALFDTFWEEPLWHGGFLWKWFPEMKGHEGYPEKDYTPQGKKAAKIIEKWYAE